LKGPASSKRHRARSAKKGLSTSGWGSEVLPNIESITV